MGDLPGRRSIRLRGYDYTEPGWYFVTICTIERRCLFGDIVADKMCLNVLGEAVVDAWQAIPQHLPMFETDSFIVMPNHFHGIIVLEADVGAKHASPLHQRRARGTAKGSLPAVVQSFKSASTRSANRIRTTPGRPLWQRGFYERVIRSDEELNQLRRYIEDNPLRWALDQENPSRTSM